MSTSPQAHEFGHPPASIRIGDMEVRRLGYGAMQLPGKDVWGDPADPAGARALLRRVIDLGINFIDTSWYYGPLVANRLIAEALHPYPRDLVIATKLGGKRLPDKGWAAYIRPEELRAGCEEDLRSLKLERLDVVHLRYIKTDVPFEESLDAMIAMQTEGKIRHIALSNVPVAFIEKALRRTPIVAVQNLYSVYGGGGMIARMTHAEIEAPEAVLDLCTSLGIAFLPFFPLAMGKLDEHGAVQKIAKKHGATAAQIGIAWLLARSPTMLPIPGTSSIAHLEENWAARTIKLDDEDVKAIAAAA